MVMGISMRHYGVVALLAGTLEAEVAFILVIEIELRSRTPEQVPPYCSSARTCAAQ